MQTTWIWSQWLVASETLPDCYFPFSGIQYGQYSYSTSRKQMDNVICTGTESQLKDCSHDVHVTEISNAMILICEYCE